jgi:hypothetical protein
MRKYLSMAVIGLVAVVVAIPGAAEAKRSAKGPVAHAAKCKKKKHRRKCKERRVPAPVAPPAALPITESEAHNAVVDTARSECLVDAYCYAYGYYYDAANPSQLYCDTRQTYTWACYGWNDEYDYDSLFYTCDFREVIQRVGYNGINAYRDTTYAGDGWDCHL